MSSLNTAMPREKPRGEVPGQHVPWASRNCCFLGGVSIAGHQRSPDQYKLPSIGRGGQGEARAEVSMEDEETEPRGRGSPKARL